MRPHFSSIVEQCREEEIGLAYNVSDERYRSEESSRDDENLGPWPARSSLQQRLSSFVRPTLSWINVAPNRYLCVAVAVFVLLGWLSSDIASASHPRGYRPIRPPPSTRIVALVFYGRRDRSSILDCYLRKNLKVNGGWLDEVIWGVNTIDGADLAYLGQMLATTPEYRKLQPKLQPNERSYAQLWNQTLEMGNIYIKVDDDVVFIDDDAIPRMVDTLLSHPEALMVSANTVNSAKLSWLQYRTGAILPYLPELGKRPADRSVLSSRNNTVWRASKLPSWRKSDELTAPMTMDDFRHYLGSQDSENLPQHRWLPVQGENAICHTPITKTEFADQGRGLLKWAIAAQQHYSFLDRLEHDQENLFTIGHGSMHAKDTIWDMTGEQLSINFIAVRGEEILDNIDQLAAFDDEQFLSVILPAQLNKRITVQTSALGAHFSYQPQRTGLENTDILARYRAYALEKVCPTSFRDPYY